MANLYKGLVQVDVLMYIDYTADGITIPASEQSPCKLSLPLTVAERFVRNGLADYCDIADEDGTKGAPGEPGCAGTDGTDGSPGAPGCDGEDGEDGKDGLVGMTGDRGRVGRHNNTPGSPGRKGCTGEPGPDGVDGNDGEDGREGEQGVDGPMGEQGWPGMIGIKGNVGDIGMQGNQGPNGEICEDGPIECIRIDDCTYRIITRDANCEILDDFIWNIPKLGTWCREEVVTIDFDATDFKTVDNTNGVTYEVPVGSSGQVCTIEMNFGVPSNQPCRSRSCGYGGDNPYEDDMPNINAYGPADGACEFHPVEVCFDKPICGDLAITFIDVDEYVNNNVNIDCGEKIQVNNTSGANITPSAELVEGPTGVYSPSASQGTGNTNTNGTLTWVGLDGVDCLYFGVQLQSGQSMGFGFAGTQSFKTVETGTYIGDQFFDANGNPISEPEGWVDC